MRAGGVRTALAPTAVSWAASLAFTWLQLETASVSRNGESEAGGLRAPIFHVSSWKLLSTEDTVSAVLKFAV